MDKMILALLMCLAGCSLCRAQANGFFYQVGMAPNGMPVMEAGVPAQSFATNYQEQIGSNWCWAASIANIFGYYGHVVPQTVIVARIKNVIANVTASPAEISEAVSQVWTDSDGKTFKATLKAAYDPADGFSNISDAYILNELASGHPLIMCNTHHCMDIVAEDTCGQSITRIVVFDPSPESPGPHPLPYLEGCASVRILPTPMGPQRGQLTYVAAVDISDLP